MKNIDTSKLWERVREYNVRSQLYTSLAQDLTEFIKAIEEDENEN